MTRLAAQKSRQPARHLIALAMLLLTACGGGGGSGDDRSLWEQRTARSAVYAAQCAAPRSGTDPFSAQPYPDRQGSLDDEKRWLRTYLDEIYLWYREIPGVDPAPYTAAAYGSSYAALDGYFEALKTPALTASGKRKDRFSFTYPTYEWNAQSLEGVSLGYGWLVLLRPNRPPREAVVAYTDAGSPAAAAVQRGTRILAIDGVDLVYDDTPAGVDALNAGLFPRAPGEQHVFTVQDPGSATTRQIVLSAAQIVQDPAPTRRVIDTPGGPVGYLLFNDHIATAEGALHEAMQAFAAAGIGDLVLDLRYNGGGFLDIASELAYMIAGPTRTAGRDFERLQFNDKNPYAQGDGARTPFHARSQGFDPRLPEGTALPHLDLGRVYVLTTSSTCSASEAIINGLRGVDVEVIQIGSPSCGKPYGFYGQDNCGLSYFAIEFAGVNAQGFGDYAEGFVPSCAGVDDFAHALGDPQEGMLSLALQVRDGNGCANAKSIPLSAHEQAVRSPLRENRFWRPRP